MEPGPQARRSAGRARLGRLPRATRRLPGSGRRPLGAAGPRRADHRLRVRLRQPGDRCAGSGIPPPTRDRYTLLEALPQMRGSRALRRLRATSARPASRGSQEVTYDTPFGDGYMLGTFVQRTAKLGDGLVVFLTDVTEQRRMEADLRSYADLVAHDLREPVVGIAHLVTLLERRADEPPAPEVLRLLRASTERATRPHRRRADLRPRGRAEHGAGRARPPGGRGRRRPAPRPRHRGRDARGRRAAGGRTATRASSGGCCRTSSATRCGSAARPRRASSCPRCATARSGW